MQHQIALDRDFIPLVNRGMKTTTVRAGQRAYTLGPAELISENVTIPIDIREVSYRYLNELTTEDAKSDGFDHRDELFDALRRYYPEIQPDEPVTIVRFSLVGLDRNTHPF